MNILDAKLNYHEGYSNDITLQVLVDEIPHYSSLVYKQNGNLYFAEKDGLVSYYLYARPGDGYGGNVFKIQVLTDEGIEVKELIGPWSSRSGVMNKYFEHSMEVNITDKKEVFEKGFTFNAGAITIEKVKEAIKMVQGAVLCSRKYADGEINYFINKMWYSQTDKYEIIGR